MLLLKQNKGLFFLKVVLFFSGIHFYCESNGQPAHAWSFNLGGNDWNDNGQDIAVDGSGNCYITGRFAGSGVDFDPGAGSVPLSSNIRNIYVAKYDASRVYQWAFAIDGQGTFNDYGDGIAVDGSGNCYVTGSFAGSNVDFNPGAGAANLSSAGNQDIFVAKYNSSGAYQWAFNIGGTSSDWGYGIAADNSGNCYVTGQFIGANIDFGSGNLLSSAGGSTDIFVAKYNSSGTYQWAYAIGGTSSDIGYGITVDKTTGTSYVTGNFNGTNINFYPPGSVPATSIGGGMFLAQYNSAGVCQWADAMGADLGNSVALDGSGNAYVTGKFQFGSRDFDPGAGTALLSSAGGEDIFVAKYSSAGAYLWAFRMGNGAGFNNDIGYGIAVDGSGNCYVTGQFTGTTNFNPSGTANLVSLGNTDIFVAEYNSSGAYLWAFSIGASDYEQGNGIALYGTSPYVTGTFSGTNTDFDWDVTTANLTGNGGGTGDIFIARYGNAPTPIELLYFTAVLTTDQKVLCEWATASEFNNDYFLVERTQDGINYESVIQVDGAGSSNNTLYYSSVDPDPFPGVSYYRLKQVDFNGAYTYSYEVAVNLKGIDIISIYPNPASGYFGYLVGSTGEGTISVEVEDAFGRNVILKEETITKGITQKQLNVSSLASGTYIMTLTMGGLESRHKQFLVR